MVEDLTSLAQSGELPPTVLGPASPSGLNGARLRLFDQVSRALYRRRSRHVLLIGERGVGKTTLVRELARQAAEGGVPFLREKRFLRFDGESVPREESRRCFAGLLGAFAGAQDLVLCLDGLASLLRTDSGVTNVSFLRQAFRHPSLHVIGVLSTWDFDDLLSGDAGLLDLCTVIRVPEPDEETALAIVHQAAAGLEREFGVSIAPQVIEKSVRLSSKYIWNQRLPQKAIGILERVCEEVDYERTQLGHVRDSVSADDVIRVVSELSRVPPETLAGDIDDTDYEQVLGASVVGQDEAVGAVATELRLIRAGITDPGKPASVMLFCGLNGVGKTERAKKLAEIYSASKRLQIYTMGNFVESHAVSGIIGVPAGYVGHDQGGRLINDLNADPYGVFLLDEIEKAHPDVLKPFLNLFDEGWIVDQRGVKAYADRAIFILTSNAGYEAISQMHEDKRPMEEIAEHVKRTLALVRNERSSQPVLSTAFLSRIKRIIALAHPYSNAAFGVRRAFPKLQFGKIWEVQPSAFLRHVSVFEMRIPRVMRAAGIRCQVTASNQPPRPRWRFSGAG